MKKLKTAAAAVVKVKKKVGPRPSMTVTKEMIEEVRQLAGLGLTGDQMAKYYGICRTTWYKYIDMYPEIQIAAERGKYRMISIVAGKLMEKVKAGNLTAIIFYLKTQAHWREVRDADPLPARELEASIQINVSDPVAAAKMYQLIMLRD